MLGAAISLESVALRDSLNAKDTAFLDDCGALETARRNQIQNSRIIVLPLRDGGTLCREKGAGLLATRRAAD